MRLRQIAIAAANLDESELILKKELNINVAYRDPGVEKFGLNNIVCPVGGEFLEVVSPFLDGTTAGRFIEKKKGAAGYMTIFQCNDAIERRSYLMEKGIRLVHETNDPDFLNSQFHPKDIPGALLEIDSVPNNDCTDKYSDWPPAGKNWKEAINKNYVLGIAGATIASDNPLSLSDLWSDVLDCKRFIAGDAIFIELENTTINFVQKRSGYSDLVGIKLFATEKRINIKNKINILGLDIEFIESK